MASPPCGGAREYRWPRLPSAGEFREWFDGRDEAPARCHRETRRRRSGGRARARVPDHGRLRDPHVPRVEVRSSRNGTRGGRAPRPRLLLLLLHFPHLADKADSLARQRADEALTFAIITDRAAGRVDAGGER